MAFGAAAAPVVRQWGPLPAVLGGLVLIVLAVLGLVRSGAAGSVEGTPASPGSAWQRFGLFLGLTAINPATLVYFAAVTVGLGEPLREARAAAVFVAGIGLTSLLWQLIVVGTGAVLRHRVTERTRRRSRQAGSLVVAALGVGMLIGALP